MVSADDMLRYEFQDLLFRKVFETEAVLHDEEDPTVIATRVMQTACELYDADWCGILIADLQTQAFIPEIWYEVGLGPMKDTLFNDIEFTEEFATWAQCLVEQKPVVIPNVEAIRETSPKEYEAYQRLDARSIMGVPFGQHPLGFMVIRNLKRYVDHPEPLRLACFVAMMMLEQIRRQRIEKVTHVSDEPDDGKFHIRYNILGPHNMVINGREVCEDDLPHPNRRAWVILLYLVLHRQPVDQIQLISENWPDDDETSSRNAMRQALFRLHNELSAYHDVKVVELFGGKIKFSDDVRVTTDAAEMEELFERSKSMPENEDKLEVLKKAFSLYRGRLFMQGDTELGDWLMPYTVRYNQVFVDIATELLKMLGHHKDYRCIMDYAPVALEHEPGMHAAYYWIVIAADGMGNSVAREKALEKAKMELTDEEYGKLMILLRTVGHASERKVSENNV